MTTNKEQIEALDKRLRKVEKDMNGHDVFEFRLVNTEADIKDNKNGIKANGERIYKIELEMKDLKLIRQIVFGLVGLALLSVWDKLPI